MIRAIVDELDEVDAALRSAAEPERAALLRRQEALIARCRSLTAEQRVLLARHVRRPKATEFIDALCTDFFEQRGDRQCREDASIACGIALYHGRPVTVVGHRKGRTIEENMACNFGMPGPEGYRKAQRVMRQAEKFGRPVLAFIDTPGAYPGVEAEERGQGEAIAGCIALMSALRVPIVAVITGEGSSGGALAIGMSDRVLMLENAYYSVVSPEACASILWKDARRRADACEALRLTAQELDRLGVIDGIIPEPPGGAQRDPAAVFRAADGQISRALAALEALTPDALVQQRYEKYRTIGL